MTKDDYSNKSTFLYNAIKDAQDLIKFYDTKTGVAVVIVAAMWAYFIKLVPEFPICLCWCSLLLCINPLLLFCNMSFVTYLIYKIIFPQVNPANSIIADSISEDERKIIQQNLFFIPPNAKDKHKTEFGKYYTNLSGLTEEPILKVLSHELLKVSFIRNLKHQRFETMAKTLIILGLHYLIFVFVHYKIMK